MHGQRTGLTHLRAALTLLAIFGPAAVCLQVAGRALEQSGNTGEITGKIYFEGDRPKLLPLNMGKDPVCQSEHTGTVYAEDGAVNENGTLPNAFVYVKGSNASVKVVPPRNSVDLTQQGCMYEPHVLGIMVGQPLQVQTLDPTTHNIHVMASGNREWNVTQEPGSASAIRKFTRAEIMIPVHCNEHPWMKAYIGVVDNPYFAVTGNKGSFVLKGLPAGKYIVAVWTATFGSQEQEVTVGASESATANFTFRNRQGA